MEVRPFHGIIVLHVWMIGCLLCCCPGIASPQIRHLPPQLDHTYDISWQMHFAKFSAMPVQLNVETEHGSGYRLSVTGSGVIWEKVSGKSAVSVIRQAYPFRPDLVYTFSLKRRDGALAFLCNHRLLFTTPMRGSVRGAVTFRAVPHGVTVTAARYIPIATQVFGDDFMRPEALEKLMASGQTGKTPWIDDDIWPVAYYQRYFPGDHPNDPKTGRPFINPWQLSFFPVVATSTNGFWLLYTGDSPSWVIANPTMVPAYRDCYYVQAAIRPDYESEVGLLAAYQDNRNYLLFCWRSQSGTSATKARAELLAKIAGKTVVLATDSHGFEPAQWYTARINLDWQRVQVLIDGRVLFDVPNRGLIEGQVGLYANGVANPHRPALDAKTSTMYAAKDATTGRLVNEAIESQSRTNNILFDDVAMGDWTSSRLEKPIYVLQSTGSWLVRGTVLRAASPGERITGLDTADCYILRGQLRLPADGRAGIIIHRGGVQRPGYLWTLSTGTQQLLSLVQGGKTVQVDAASIKVSANAWINLRVEVDGPYVACFCNGRRVFETYNPSQRAGRYGLYAATAGVQFRDCVVEPFQEPWQALQVHDGFADDRWLSTWAGTEADWTPGFTPQTSLTASGYMHEEVGAAAPYPTLLPGLYWHKGGHYHDVRVSIPFSPKTIAGQELYITTNYQENSGYRLEWNRAGTNGTVRIYRKNDIVRDYTFPLADAMRAVVERHGTLLIVRVQALSTAPCLGDPEILRETCLPVYRDPHSIAAEQIGFRVTDSLLPAAAIRVDSDRIQEAFEKSPVGWRGQNGIWKVMARYTCQPQWNWFGGFGSGTPTLWSKYRLDGDQNVEAYMSIKMQYSQLSEEYEERYRDLNMTICGDGIDARSGYAVIRAGRQHGEPATMLLRQGKVVQVSTLSEDLLPGWTSGHRQWFATRIEKRAGEIKVFLDNRLAMTYVDPVPLSGGYVAVWTENNGIMLARANFSARQMSSSGPRARVRSQSVTQ